MTRLSADGLTRLRERLSPEDWAVLASLERLRLLTAGQLRRLHWPDPAAARTARRRLAWLNQQRLTVRLERRVGGIKAGSDGFVYALDLAGQRLLGIASTRQPHQPGWAYLRHRLAVSEVYVRSHEAETRGEMKVLEFSAEPACWRRYGSGLLKPDAALVLATDEFEHHAFIEMDCATEAATTIAAKAQAYERYYHTGIEQQRLDLFPKVVWVVPSDRRKAQIIEALGRRPAEVWRLHLVVRADEVPAALIN